MENDVLVLLILTVTVTLLAVVTEICSQRAFLPQWLARKVLHLGAVGACALAPMLLDELEALILIVAFAELLLIWLVTGGLLFLDDRGRRSWGIMLFPLPYLALLLLFPEPGDRWLIGLPMALLAVSDALAAIVGITIPSRSYTLTGDRKTIGGSLTFAFTAWWLIVLFPGPLTALPTLQLHAFALFCALLIAAFEALGSNGRDNLYIPVAAFPLLQLPIHSNTPTLLVPWLAVPIAVAFVVMMVRRNHLTLGGAVAAALLGLWVLYFQGILWIIPLLFFFISSTALGKRFGANSASSDAKSGRARDADQVFCNGGVYGLAAAVLPTPEAHVIMAVSMAVATADTWASEIGMGLKGVTYDIRNMRRVPAGLSGGISFAGTAGALGGALLAAATCVALMNGGFIDLPWGLLATLTAWGTIGMFADSLFGATLQPRYRTPNGVLQDEATEGSVLASGVYWMSNDRVNLLSNALISAVAFCLLYGSVGT